MLATMETKAESSTTCALFWKMWNKALGEVKGDPNYTYNPKGFMTDEAGANVNGILQVYVLVVFEILIPANSILSSV